MYFTYRGKTMKNFRIDYAFIVETLRYFICGVSTVAVNIVVYRLLSYVWGTLAANTSAFLVSVFYAYFTNSVFVFRVHLTWKSFREFFGMRIGTILIDNGGMLLLIWVGMHDMIAKCIVNIIIIGINYVFSKLFIFKRK